MNKYKTICDYEMSPVEIGYDEDILKKIEAEKNAIISLDYTFGALLEPYFSKLKDADKEFLILRYGENYTRKELAQMYNKSVEAVVSQERSALGKLRRAMGLKK